MASRSNNRYSAHDNTNRLSGQYRLSHHGQDRMNKLSEMTMSNYIASQAKLKKRSKIKGHLSSADSLTFLPGEGHSRVVVSDCKAGSVVLISDDAKSRTELMKGTRPHGVACLDAQRIVVVDEDDKGIGSVKVVSISDYSNASNPVLNQWKSDSDAWQPRGVAVTRHDQIVVTNTHPDAIERFWLYSSDGTEAMSFGRAKGPADLVFRTPNYVTTDDFGRIIATDTDGDCVKMFDPRGRYLGEFGNVGHQSADKGSKLSKPRGIVCDKNNNIIVCDSGNRRLAMFSHDGKFICNLREAQKPGLSPIDVALNSASDRLAFSVHNKNGNCRKLVLYNYIIT